jgi:hypothetical protein
VKNSSITSRVFIKNFFVIVGKICLMLFVTWNMFAVGIYAVPREAEDKIAVAWKQVLLPIVSPYVLFTSQWQLWNIFAPDPLRRVTFYRIETQQDGMWKEVTTIKPGSFSIWRHATQFKMLGNILDENSQDRAPIAGRFLHLFCGQEHIASTTPIRLVYVYYIIPYHSQRMPPSWWDTWLPDISSYVGFNTTCP